MLSGIKTEIEKLSQAELEELVSHIYGIITKMTIAETDEPQELKCPFCESCNWVKNGVAKGKQRYKCKRCGKGFGLTTGTIKFHSKITDDQWKKYIECMILSYSIRKTAKIVDVGVKIAFYLRHKILDCLRKNLNGGGTVLFGDCELDETFLPENFKGNHKKSGFEMPRKAKKRGHSDKKRGVSKDKICIGTGMDKNNNMIIKMICRGRASHKNLKDLFKGNIHEGSIIVTDGLSGYKKLAHDVGAKQIIIPPKKHANGVYNLQKINALHSRFKSWISGFNGVSTKLLPNYLGWFKFVEIFKSLSDNEKSGKIWGNATTERVRSRMVDIRHRAIVFG
ncbi:MAG: IS1595 family transposase [Oscillospiraceae bacterium]|nr:IS1595 family transposase [Oscillospiraceae bacterium]